MRRKFPLAVFCDFDGTFSVQDVGATLAQRIAPERRPAAWARFERGEITAWDYNLEILDGLALPLADLEAFLQTVELDPGARALVDWCDAKGVPFRVLSDGFDFNLNRLQVIHAVRFAYDANRLRYQDGRWRIQSGHPNPDCGCGTGTCKRGRIDAFRREHSGARANVPLAAWDEAHALLKVNPVADWEIGALDAYLAEHNIPVNPLHARGFISIGCQPCTRAVQPGEDPRSGRWWWENEEKKECGLHLNPRKEGKAA